MESNKSIPPPPPPLPPTLLSSKATNSRVPPPPPPPIETENLEVYPIERFKNRAVNKAKSVISKSKLKASETNELPKIVSSKKASAESSNASDSQKLCNFFRN